MINFLKSSLGIFLAFCWLQAAEAQSTNFGFAPSGSTQSLAVSGTNNSITLNSNPGDTVLIQNSGANTAFVRCGPTAATVNDFPIQAGWGIALNCPPNNKVNGITASSTTTLLVSKGLGSFSLTGGGGGGGGGGGNVVITSPITNAGADGVSNTLDGVQTYARTQCYNGTTWDRCTQIGTGTPGTPNLTTVLSVQGEASMTPFLDKITDGTNVAAVKAASTGPLATDPALVVSVSPNGLNANGQATMANSAPVVIASNQSNLAVIGPTADGTAASTNPVLVAGTVDGTGTGAVAVQKVTAGGVASTDLTTLNGVALGSPTNFGTTPGAVAVQGVNSSLFQGTAAISQTNPTFAAITDSTNKAAVKAASTAPVATDPALVVTLSPDVGGITPVVSSALESNHVIKGGAGVFIQGYITTGAVQGWLLIANSTTAPTAGGAAIAPLACVFAPANATTSIGGGPSIIASTGVTMVFSSSGCLTNTASATAFFSGQAL